MGFCTQDELKAARDEVNAIGKLVTALREDASPATAVAARIVQLYASPCFLNGQLARDIEPSDITPATSWAIKQWWSEDGGYAFFADALDHAAGVHLAPSLPQVLAAERLGSQDPLRNFLCPSSGTECDPVAAGAALDLSREIARVGLFRGGASLGTTVGDPEDHQQGCAQEAAKKPPDRRLSTYVACLDAYVTKSALLPTARYRSPKGWLVLRGRRGHYGFCDEARAYDLETGTAYVVSRCAQLMLGNDGTVDQAATHASGAVKTHVGTMSPDALRRLAMALALKDKIVTNSQRYAEFALPENIPLPDRDGGFGFGVGLGGAWGTSAQTVISFDLIGPTGGALSGTFVWPDSSDLGDQVADDLVVSAEKTFVEGCPKVALPPALSPAKSLGGVSRLDASPDALQKTARELSAAFAQLGNVKVCKK